MKPIIITLVLVLVVAFTAQSQSFYSKKKKHFRINTHHVNDFKRSNGVYRISVLRWLPHRKQWVGANSKLKRQFF